MTKPKQKKVDRDYSARGLMWDFIEQIEYIIRKALHPDFPGLLNPAENSTLKRAAENIRPTLSQLDQLLSQKNRDEAYKHILNLIRDIHAVGATVVMTDSQKSFFKPIIARERAVLSAKKSAEARALKADKFRHPEVLRLAIAERKSDPYVSNKALARTIVETWNVKGIKPPAHRTVLDYLSILEKGGRLPVKARRRSVKQKTRFC